MPTSGRLPLPFEPPNKNVCLVLYQPQLNHWNLVFSSFDRASCDPWIQAIRKTNGYYEESYITDRTVAKNQWDHHQRLARTLMAKGYQRVLGSFKELSASGTQWLQSDIRHWWHMQSASLAQLNVVKGHPNGSEMIMQSLHRHGRLGVRAYTPGRRGPSIVEHRWNTVFPTEMAFAHNCNALGIEGHQAIQMWKQTQRDAIARTTDVAPEEWAHLLGVMDLR